MDFWDYIINIIISLISGLIGSLFTIKHQEKLIQDSLLLKAKSDLFDDKVLYSCIRVKYKEKWIEGYIIIKTHANWEWHFNFHPFNKDEGVSPQHSNYYDSAKHKYIIINFIKDLYDIIDYNYNA